MKPTTGFTLHPSLHTDTVFVTDWALCRVLLMKDARFPWLILVPRRAGIMEIHELALEERLVMIEEVARASEKLKALSAADKINVGALGNLVSQLHIHVIARRTGDVAWPGPVWGSGHSVAYTEHARERMLQSLRNNL